MDCQDFWIKGKLWPVSELGGKETVVGVASAKCRVLNVIDDDGRAVVDFLPVGWIVVEGVHDDY